MKNTTTAGSRGLERVGIRLDVTSELAASAKQKREERTKIKEFHDSTAAAPPKAFHVSRTSDL